jgi:uncharacterized membrane protein
MPLLTVASEPARPDRPAVSWRSVEPTRLLLFVAVAAYSASFAALSILQQRAFNTGRFDMGNMVQAVWSTAHGHFLQITDLHGDQVSRLGSHFDPILALFAPLWWIWPSPNMLLTAQAIAIGLGALPVYWLGRKHLASSRAALGFALAYLLYPPVEWLTLNEFHPVALACPFLLFAFWYLDEDRLLAFGVFALLACLTKEEIPLALAVFGAWYGLRRRHWVAGGAIVLTAIAVFVIALLVVIPHFNHGAGSAFYERYTAVGGSPEGVLHTAATHPWRLFEKAFNGRGLRYLGTLIVPLLLLPLAAPLVAAAAVPELAINLLSKTPTQTSIHFHYTAGLIAPLVAGSVLGAARIVRFRPRAAVPLALAAVLIALAANHDQGPIPLWRFVPGGHAFINRDIAVSAHDRIAERGISLIPDGQAVSTTNSLGAAPRLQLPHDPGCALDRGRREAAELGRPPDRAPARRPDRSAAPRPELAPRLRGGRRARVQARLGPIS